MEKTQIERICDTYINHVFKEKPEVKRFLINHERKGKFLDNMQRELYHMESPLSYKPVKLSAMDRVRAVEDCTNLFCVAALEAKETILRTDIENSRRETELNPEPDPEIEAAIGEVRVTRIEQP